MSAPRSPHDALASFLREAMAAHAAEVDRLALTLLPYSLGTHEFTLEVHPFKTVLCWRGLRYAVHRPIFSTNAPDIAQFSDY